MSALFPRSFYSEDPSFTNLFRMLDDFNTYASEARGASPRGRGRHGIRQRVFNPRFDVRETDSAYELHGELPGIDRNDVQIEFTEPSTMTISGRVERNYSSGTPPAGLVEDTRMSGAITEGGEVSSHKATVSDEADEATKEKGQLAEAEKKEEAPQPTERYWHQERTIGEFHRSFTFPARVDESTVSANLNNGILHVTVPKAGKRENRRITIE